MILKPSLIRSPTDCSSRHLNYYLLPEDYSLLPAIFIIQNYWPVKFILPAFVIISIEQKFNVFFLELKR